MENEALCLSLYQIAILDSIIHRDGSREDFDPFYRDNKGEGYTLAKAKDEIDRIKNNHFFFISDMAEFFIVPLDYRDDRELVDWVDCKCPGGVTGSCRYCIECMQHIANSYRVRVRANAVPY
jgi:hypothetical protein